MNLRYLGHSCFEISLNERTLLIDPYISPNPLASKIEISSLSPDLVLVSHAHQDHIHDAPNIARQSGATVLSNFEICTKLKSEGIATYPMNHGGVYQEDGMKIAYVNAVHTSSFPDGSYGGQPGGWVIESQEKTIYFAGDTDLMSDMELLGKRWNIDLALLPIGGRFTMSWQEVPLACEMLACTTVIGMHYDTFDPIRVDHETAMKYCEENGVKLILLEVGGGLSD